VTGQCTPLRLIVSADVDDKRTATWSH
jgi:hypothetical protein